jgi:hypothetical protein
LRGAFSEIDEILMNEEEGFCCSSAEINIDNKVEAMNINAHPSKIKQVEKADIVEVPYIHIAKPAFLESMH